VLAERAAIKKYVSRGDSVFSKAFSAIIFAFIVGGLLGYGISTTQALNNAVALADAVRVPDARQVEIASPTPIKPCPPSQDIVNNAGVPMTPTADPTGSYINEPPVTEVTESPADPYPTKNPQKSHLTSTHADLCPTAAPTATSASPAPTKTSCVPPATQTYPTQIPTATATATATEDPNVRNNPDAQDPNTQEPHAQPETNA
jgi:hypothetical protein